MKFSVFLLMMFAFGFSVPCEANDIKYKIPKYKVGEIGDSIEVLDASKKADGFWIYSPKGQAKSANNVVVFIHGYGAFNPMIFGAWIKHLVADGNIVIYPRYQKSLSRPLPRRFVPKALTGIKEALLLLADRGVNPDLWSSLDVVAHSYGGVISSNLAQNIEAYDIPPIKSLMICSAGSGPFKGGILDAYDKVESNLIIIDSEKDSTVGSRFSKYIDGLTPTKQNKVYLRQSSYRKNGIRITSHHNEPYALDQAFDNGIRNYTAKKALRVGYVNLVDTEGYWKLFDHLMEEEEGFSMFDASMTEWGLSMEHPEIKLTVVNQ